MNAFDVSEQFSTHHAYTMLLIEGPNHSSNLTINLIAGEVSNRLGSLWLSGIPPQSVLCFCLEFIANNRSLSLSLLCFTFSALLLRHPEDH